MNDGGPAFPRGINGRYPDGFSETEGMSLRDYFAAKATDKDIEKYRGWVPDKDESSFLMKATYTRTEARYRFADDMIKERTK